MAKATHQPTSTSPTLQTPGVAARLARHHLLKRNEDAPALQAGEV